MRFRKEKAPDPTPTRYLESVRMRIHLEDGVVKITESFPYLPHTSTPPISIGDSDVTIGCARVSIEVFEFISRAWDDYRKTTRKELQ